MRTPIAAYKVVQEGSPSHLEHSVNELIGQGWQPYGPMCLVAVFHPFDSLNEREGGYTDSSFAQAMVKYA